MAAQTAVEKQRTIDAQRGEAADSYSEVWKRIINGWRSPDRQDSAWLMYSGNYLFRTGGLRWALDPLSLHSRVPEAPQVPLARDLKGLNFVLLTHRHTDHLDIELLHEMRGAPIQWVAPEAILPFVINDAGLSPKNVAVPRPLKPIQFQGITITPFNGLHWEVEKDGDGETLKDIPAMGYLVEQGGKRWLFPGDTRTYDPSRIPAFGAVDAVFAHVWLGRGSALKDHPPLLEAYCQFYLHLQPRRLVLTHLHEFGREASEYWDEEHAASVIRRLGETCPEIRAEAARMGDRVRL